VIKNLGRILIILIAAALIALGWYAFSTTAIGSRFTPPDRPANFAPLGEPPGEMSEGRPPRPEGGEMGFSLARLFIGMAANVGITALVIVLVVWLRKLIHRLASSPFKFAGMNL
jgi:hypothetical protein